MNKNPLTLLALGLSSVALIVAFLAGVYPDVIENITQIPVGGESNFQNSLLEVTSLGFRNVASTTEDIVRVEWTDTMGSQVNQISWRNGLESRFFVTGIDVVQLGTTTTNTLFTLDIATSSASSISDFAFANSGATDEIGKLIQPLHLKMLSIGSTTGNGVHTFSSTSTFPFWIDTNEYLNFKLIAPHNCTGGSSNCVQATSTTAKRGFNFMFTVRGYATTTPGVVKR